MRNFARGKLAPGYTFHWNYGCDVMAGSHIHQATIVESRNLSLNGCGVENTVRV